MTRNIEFRFPVLRNSVEIGALSAPENSAPKITMDDTGEIKTRLSGDFLPPSGDIDLLTDEIRPTMIVDGTPYPLGLFLATKDDERETETGTRIHVDAFDRGWIVRDHKTEHLLFFPAGTNYLDAVGSLLIECGITVISSVPTEAALTEDREDWPIGTSNLQIINGLLREINYEDLWFDANGTAILEPKATPTAENIDHILDESDIESLMIPGLSRSTDVYSQANVFLCICSNADKGAGMFAIAENTNPQSPLSIARRGRRITKVVQVNNIASQEELQLAADRMAIESLMKGERLDLKTCLLPGYGVGDVIALKYKEISAICTERRWSMDLKVGGIMQHTLERVVMNLD